MENSFYQVTLNINQSVKGMKTLIKQIAIKHNLIGYVQKLEYEHTTIVLQCKAQDQSNQKSLINKFIARFQQAFQDHYAVTKKELSIEQHMQRKMNKMEIPEVEFVIKETKEDIQSQNSSGRKPRQQQMDSHMQHTKLPVIPVRFVRSPSKQFSEKMSFSSSSSNDKEIIKQQNLIIQQLSADSAEQKKINLELVRQIQELVKQNLEFRQQQESLKKREKIAHDIFSKGLTKEGQRQDICSICLNENSAPNIALIPCGHRICHVCVSDLKEKAKIDKLELKCMLCRQVVEATQLVFS